MGLKDNEVRRIIRVINYKVQLLRKQIIEFDKEGRNITHLQAKIEAYIDIKCMIELDKESLRILNSIDR